jgi:hypothetical protein
MRQRNTFQQWIGEVVEERHAQLLQYQSLPVSKAWPGCLVIQSLPQGTLNHLSYPKIIVALSFMDKDCHAASIVHYMSHPGLQLRNISECWDI